MLSLTAMIKHRRTFHDRRKQQDGIASIKMPIHLEMREIYYECFGPPDNTPCSASQLFWYSN